MERKKKKKKSYIFSLLSVEVSCSILHNLFKMQSFIKVKKFKNVSCFLNSSQLKLDRADVNFRAWKALVWARKV